MKTLTTKKAIRERFNNIISVSYCGLQYLLKYQEPFAYSSGIYGWSCDYYYIEGLCISMGYRPIGQKVNYNTLNDYENKAKAIISDINISREEKQLQVNILLENFIQQL